MNNRHKKNMTSTLVTHAQFHSPELQRDTTLRVLLPRNYNKHKEQKFPVLYLQDGQNLFDAETSAFGHWKLREVMARQPLYRQAILVGIDNAGNNRIHEYAPLKRVNSDGRGELYLTFLIETVKPFIDVTYRTWPHREATGIAGSSLGGLLSFYAGLRYSAVFGKVGALSPSFWLNPQVISMAETEAIKPKSQIYICASKTEMQSMASTLEQTYWSLIRGGFSNEQIRVVGRERGKHNEAFWGREFKPMYEWLFPKTLL
jgi:alpha-glucosidase